MRLYYSYTSYIFELSAIVNMKPIFITQIILDNNQVCKVEFNQPSCWLYSVPNLLVFQQLVTLYLGEILVRVVS